MSIWWKTDKFWAFINNKSQTPTFLLISNFSYNTTSCGNDCCIVQFIEDDAQKKEFRLVNAADIKSLLETISKCSKLKCRKAFLPFGFPGQNLASWTILKTYTSIYPSIHPSIHPPTHISFFLMMAILTVYNSASQTTHFVYR